jgi:alkylhydroperoxidase/carboxymuconolactone decarboxylase family protein YurZ
MLEGTHLMSGDADGAAMTGPHAGSGSYRERGAEIRRTVLGDRHANPPAPPGPLGSVWREHSDAVAWGQVWTRPGLDLRLRTICTVAVLCALGEHQQLATHIRGALRQGVTPAELAEIFIHVGSYAGAPKAASAITIADTLLADYLEQQ